MKIVRLSHQEEIAFFELRLSPWVDSLHIYDGAFRTQGVYRLLISAVVLKLDVRYVYNQELITEIHYTCVCTNKKIIILYYR